MMALVAYSDESDLSDTEEMKEKLVEEQSVNKPLKPVTNNNNEKIIAGIESIEGEDDFISTNTSNYNDAYDDESSSIHTLLSSIPAVGTAHSKNTKFNVEVNDVVDDVPTVKSWHINENTKVEFTTENSASTSNKKPKKRKFILPALSEFQNDEGCNEEVHEPKKIRSSAGGCGLMLLLPVVKKPQTRVNSFIPDSVKKVLKPVPKPKPKKPIVMEDSDNEDDMVSCDFFSFEDSKVLPEAAPSVLPTSIPTTAITSVVNTVEVGPTVGVNEWQNVPVYDYKQQALDLSDAPIQGPSRSSDICQTELEKLAGRRNRNEIVNIIDVNADDALMSREEWVRRALVEEKPSRSFSKKRNDGPSQQSKRKHQITYLAHQAKERELELQNNWAIARMSKSQTQAKYGF